MKTLVPQRESLGLKRRLDPTFAFCDRGRKFRGGVCTLDECHVRAPPLAVFSHEEKRSYWCLDAV